MHIIFDYEKEIKFCPLAGNGELTALLSHNPYFDDFLLEWDEMRKKHYNGELSDKELEDWKLFSQRNHDKKIDKMCKLEVEETLVCDFV